MKPEIVFEVILFVVFVIIATILFKNNYQVIGTLFVIFAHEKWKVVREDLKLK